MSETAYAQFATNTGKRIDFNKKMLRLLIASFGEEVQRKAGWGISDQAVDFALKWPEQITDPIHLIRCYMGIEARREHHMEGSKAWAVLEHVGGIKQTCWQRWGDKNWLDKRLKRNWIKETAVQLDVMCRELLENYGVSLEPEEVIEIAKEYPERWRSSEFKGAMDTLAGTFKDLVGFNLTLPFCRRLLQMKPVEDLPEMEEEAPF